MIQTLKERIRATRHSLPFKRMPRLMLVEMVYYNTMWINAFPAKYGVSNTISPRTMLTGVTLNYKKHCHLEFGAYVQVHEATLPRNSMAACTAGAIALGPCGNAQGGYQFLHLRTGKKIVCMNWTKLPMPAKVLVQVDHLGYYDNMPELLTFYD